jgi:ribulose kinase
VRAAVAAAGVDPRDVEALACATTSCTVVALDGAGRPLRPALLWMDVRAQGEADEVLATGDPALRVNGAGQGPVSAEWMIPKALWLARREPEVWSRATRIGEYQDLLNLRLTGRWCASLDNVSMRWHFQAAHGGWPDGLLSGLGLADLRTRWPDEVVAPGAVVGGLTAEAAAHLGLRVGTPVIQGGADAFIAMVGLGVTEPGDLALITGSSHLQLGIASREVHRPGVWGTYRDCVYPGKHVIEGGQTSTGSVLAWFARHFAPQGLDVLDQAARDLPPAPRAFSPLSIFRATAPPTRTAARAAPSLACRSATGRPRPPRPRGGHLPGHPRGRRKLRRRLRARRVVLAGGAARSDFWLQVHADTLGLALELPEVTEATALGAAILAAHGAAVSPPSRPLPAPWSAPPASSRPTRAPTPPTAPSTPATSPPSRR